MIGIVLKCLDDSEPKIQKHPDLDFRKIVFGLLLTMYCDVKVVHLVTGVQINKESMKQL